MSPQGGVTRRQVTTGAAALLAVGVAGCTSDDDPEAVTIGDDEACDQCGMVIADHPGPVGEVFFEDESPSDEGGPALFCSASCAYRYTLDREAEGWTREAMFLTDYSSVVYEITGDGTPVISAHLEASAFGNAEDLEVVVDSDVEGAMGPSLIPFSDGGDVAAFQKEYGGQRMAAADVDDDTLAGIGR